MHRFWSAMGPNWPFMGQKTLIFMGVSKSFGTHITEKPPRQLVRIVFGRALDQMGQKCRYLIKNASFRPKNWHFWPDMAIFGQIWAFLAHLIQCLTKKQWGQVA